MKSSGSRVFRRCLVAALCLLAANAYARPNCSRPVFRAERRDAATIQHLEKAWSVAFLQGDTEFESCLLLPDFTEINGAGRVMHLSDELALARANRGKNPPLPPLPDSHIILAGDAAAAMSRSDRGTRSRWSVDYYVWDKDRWRVYFAQWTRITGPRV